MRKKSQGFLFWGLIVIFLCGCSAGPGGESSQNAFLDFSAAVPQGTSVTIPDDFAGFMHAGYSSGDANLTREYGLINELGSCWIQRDFSWGSIQPAEATWNFSSFDSYVERANLEGKKVLGMLLYDVNWVHEKYGNSSVRTIFPNEITDFCAYATETVKRYNGKNGHGKVDAWCIWNEPNLSKFWAGTQEEFFELTKSTAQAIRNLDITEGTHSILIGGVFNTQVTNDWIDGLFAGDTMDQVDYVTFHPYLIDAKSTAYVFDSFKNKVARYDTDEKNWSDTIWVNEVGYPTYSEKGAIPDGRYGTDVYEGDMPEMVTKTITLLATEGAKTLFWYQLFDGKAVRDNGNSEDWYGLIWKKSDDEWIKKGGYWGYALCANNLPGKTYKEMSCPDSDIPPNTIQTWYFEGDDGKRVLVLWNDSYETTLKLTITLPGTNWRLWNPVNGSSAPVGKTSTNTLYPRDTYKRTLLFFTWDE